MSAGTARGALERPAYAAGERWVYVLSSAINGFPGLNASQQAAELGISGLVEVDILGPTSARVGGAVVAGVQVATHASGFLNGTFGSPANGTVHASGTFNSDTTEVWEGQDFLPTVSNGSSTYTVTVSYTLPISVQAQVWLNASTSYASLPPFNLSVGDRAAAPFTSDVVVATTASFFGFSFHNATSGSESGTWSRQVLAEENVSVAAGTFATYRLNQSLGSVAGLGIPLPSGTANETAWFSNDVGSYVKRQVYVNGTPVAELALQSYTYPAGPGGLSLEQIVVIVAAPFAVAAVALILILRRRRRKTGPGPGNAGPVGELPPKPPRGGP